MAAEEGDPDCVGGFDGLSFRLKERTESQHVRPILVKKEIWQDVKSPAHEKALNYR